MYVISCDRYFNSGIDFFELPVNYEKSISWLTNLKIWNVEILLSDAITDGMYEVISEILLQERGILGFQFITF